MSWPGNITNGVPPLSTEGYSQTASPVSIIDVHNTANLLSSSAQMLIAIATMLLNGTVLGIMLHQKVHKRDCSNRFVMSLIFASGLGGLSALAFALQIFLPQNLWGCVLLYNNLEVITFAMWMNLLFVNLDQLVKIEYPLHYPSLVTGKVVTACLVCSWIFPFSLQLIMYFADRKHFEYCKHQSLGEVNISVAYSVYMIFQGFIVPLFVIGTVQCRIIYNVWKLRRVFSIQQGKEDDLPNNRMDRIWPSVMTACIIFGTALLTSSPLYILLIMILAKPDTLQDNYTLIEASNMLTYMKFLINPIIYAVRFPYVKRVVCFLCHKTNRRRTEDINVEMIRG